MAKQHRQIAICGIDTGVGKTVVTGLLGRYLLQQGHSVITMKPVQTGTTTATDIQVHRQLMGMDWSPDDRSGRTCPHCFPFAGSPHLAARLAHDQVDIPRIGKHLADLGSRYDYVLLEGVGGLLVPLHQQVLFIDFLVQVNIPLILVSSPRLGSINHTLLSLEAIQRRHLDFRGLVYNLHGHHPKEIIVDSLQFFRQTLAECFPGRQVVLVPDRIESQAINWKPLLSTS